MLIDCFEPFFFDTERGGRRLMPVAGWWYVRFIGTGESGKSTIFKQMQILYTPEKFSEHEKASYRHVVRRYAYIV